MNKLNNFWSAFWSKIVTTYNKIFRKTQEINAPQKWGETDKINLLSIVVQKVTNLAMVEATFEVETNSEQIQALCKDLEDKRYTITSQMLAKGDYVIFPATNRRGEVIHTYVDADRFVISEMDGDDITELYGIIDEYTDNQGNDYKLIRHHKLEPNGNLNIDIYTVNNSWDRVNFDLWEDREISVIYQNANHIGIGRYKSPISARGQEDVYGKPLNFGCAEIENKILNDIANRDAEMNNGKSIIFADERIIDKAKDGRFTISENIFGKRTMADGSDSIDIYNPSLRIDEYNSKLEKDFELYEAQIGASKGILTEANTTRDATATEINSSNSNTVSLLSNIQNAVDIGNIETLKADGVLLNISPEQWKYSSDYYNPFENPQAQFDRLDKGYQDGAVESSDITSWLYPKMTDEEIAQKLQRIKEQKDFDTESAIEKALGGV